MIENQGKDYSIKLSEIMISIRIKMQKSQHPFKNYFQLFTSAILKISQHNGRYSQRFFYLETSILISINSFFCIPTICKHLISAIQSRKRDLQDQLGARTTIPNQNFGRTENFAICKK